MDASSDNVTDSTLSDDALTKTEAVHAAMPIPKRKDLIIINTGKGKTTAGPRVIIQAWGRNLKISGLQFLKNANACFGEVEAAAHIPISTEWPPVLARPVMLWTKRG